ncbi:Golgi-associated plant pathogenesis-related protein 1 [Silurus asotus]|uniref:Golgi-associated plant pathogenesis-related protein 1 n=1 Tax=Silurus asotus TaxID=30991 RepID=A0AAD5ALH7_SILAS|nr:Golgi-associated plant pathogenesis-related protein 1 [Silurus asotus]
MAGEEPVTDWYNEIKDYDFSKPGNQRGTGHFTQVVWKATTEIGVGLATDGHTSFVVGQYKPAGNIINPGYYEENVLPAATQQLHMLLRPLILSPFTPETCQICPDALLRDGIIINWKPLAPAENVPHMDSNKIHEITVDDKM